MNSDKDFVDELLRSVPGNISPIGLQNFSYSKVEIADRIWEHLSRTDFEGVVVSRCLSKSCM